MSPSLLPDMGHCQLLDTPHKWSDHAALFVTVSNVEPPLKHDPVPQSSKRLKQFDTRKQRSIAAMFAGRAASSAAKQPQNPAVGAQGGGSFGSLPTPAVGPEQQLNDLRSGDAQNSEQIILGIAEEAGPTVKRQRQEGNEIEQSVATLPESEDSAPPAEALPCDSKQGPFAMQTGSVDQDSIEGRDRIVQKSQSSPKVQRPMAKTSEQSKREKGQKGIKSFFTKPSL